MKNIIIFVLITFSVTFAQQSDTTKISQPPSMYESQKESKIYYGGGIGFSFWGDYFRISIEPMAAYKVTPKLSAGLKLMYEHINDTRAAWDVTYNNYGGSIFSRYRIIPQFYAHVEFAYYNYNKKIGGGEYVEDTISNWVPFLLLGGGYTQQVGQNTWLYAQALWDVIQDDKSPYKSGEPWISVGVSVGF
jgi:hypothetical protein